jgi:epoxyqueuosine reductase QueG
MIHQHLFSLIISRFFLNFERCNSEIGSGSCREKKYPCVIFFFSSFTISWRKLVIIENIIKEILSDDEYIHGFSDLTGLLNKKYADYPYAIVVGRILDYNIIDELKLYGPTQKYYEHYQQVNIDLAAILQQISEALTENNIECFIIKPTVKDAELDEEYFKNLTYNFSHKMAATRAGLGWIGKTDLFVSKKFGPRLRLGTILTKYRLPFSNSPHTESKCGKCNICVDKCPANAANGLLWNIDTERDKFFDAFKCREKCKELAMKNLNIDISICGICISVCPIGKKK